MKNLRNFALVVLPLAFVCIQACGTKDSDSLQWTEDVLLPDGRVLALTRYQEFKGPHEIRDTPSESNYWFEFKYPDTREVVRWQSDRDLATVALRIEPFTELLVHPEYGGMFRRNCPDPPYLLFRFENHRWVEVPVAELAGTIVRPNMTYSSKETRTEIVASNYHLTASQASRASLGPFNGHPIDFKPLATQTFGTKCDPPFNWMLGE